MSPEELRTRLAADFLTAYAMQQAERPPGLTASRLLGCSSAAARVLLNQPQGNSNDVYRGLRGGWAHDGLSDDLAEVDPGFTDGRIERFTWDPGGGLPVITGAADFLLDGIPIEIKNRPKAECRWHADHGADPQHAAQVASAAAARDAKQAFVVYLPTDGGASEIAVCEVDVARWLRETVHWLHRIDVRDEVARAVEQGVPRDRAVEQAIDPIPREPSVQWCREFCGFVKACRGDYRQPEDLEIADPVVREAAAAAEMWRQVRLDAEKREKAAKSKLTHAEGTVHDDKGEPVRVTQHKVDAKPGRRGHTRTVVERRPEA